MSGNRLEVRGIKIVTLFILLGTLVSGCAGPSALMKEVPEGQPLSSPAEGKAMIVFYRPSIAGGAVQAKVIDVTSEENPQLVGIVGSNTKVAYETDPGESLYMVVGGENTPFFRANTEAGKTYYAKVKVLMGIMYARFKIDPIRGTDLNGERFNKYYPKCKLIMNSEESYQWAEENMGSIREKKATKLPKWLEKPQEELGELTLNPEDGR